MGKKSGSTKNRDHWRVNAEESKDTYETTIVPNWMKSPLCRRKRHKDQLADHVSESFVPGGHRFLRGDQTTNEPAQETALEEERIKDEIEIQIDLLKDPDSGLCAARWSLPWGNGR